MFLIRQIVMAMEAALRKNYNIKFNIKIGFLKFKSGQLTFENNASAAEIDQLSQSSCNTQYRNNKMAMTHFAGAIDQSVNSVSIRDTISRVTSTPKSSASNLRSTLKALADPNQIDLKSQERFPRRLNSLVEGKY